MIYLYIFGKSAVNLCTDSLAHGQCIIQWYLRNTILSMKYFKILHINLVFVLRFWNLLLSMQVYTYCTVYLHLARRELPFMWTNQWSTSSYLFFSSPSISSNFLTSHEVYSRFVGIFDINMYLFEIKYNIQKIWYLSDNTYVWFRFLFFYIFEMMIGRSIRAHTSLHLSVRLLFTLDSFAAAKQQLKLWNCVTCTHEHELI